MNAFVQLIRPLNCVMGGVGVLVGMIVGGGLDVLDDPFAVLIASSVAMLYMVGGNTLNDFFDLETDSINHPERPLPSGRIGPRTAVAISMAVFIIGTLIAALLSLEAFFTAAVAAMLLVSYEGWLKRTGLPGNLSISMLVGMLFLFGGFAVDGISGGERTWVLAMLATLASLGREIIKDVQDMEGDRDRRTLPMAIGAARAKAVAAISVVVAVVLSPLPVHPFAVLGQIYLPLVIVADSIFIYAIMTFKSPGKASSLLKYAMFVALLAFIAGGLMD